MMTAVHVFSHPTCALHEMGAGHPEQPARVGAVQRALETSAFAAQLIFQSAPKVQNAALARVHTDDYLAQLEDASPKSGYAQLDADTTLNPHSLDAAKFSAGAAVAAVDWVMGGEDRRAFCNVRPPGHHALPDTAMGFCMYANVAIAAKHAVSTFGADRVAIVDFDVHHGNGTEACVAGDDRIRLYSTFQHPLYPHSGVPSSAPNVVNVPLPWGADGAAVRAAFINIVLPDLQAFAPELILISAGFDAHRDDPLASLNFIEADYAWMTAQLVAQAHRSAHGRVVSCLEGGYHLDALARSATAHVQALLETSSHGSSNGSS